MNIRRLAVASLISVSLALAGRAPAQARGVDLLVGLAATVVLGAALSGPTYAAPVYVVPQPILIQPGYPPPPPAYFAPDADYYYPAPAPAPVLLLPRPAYGRPQPASRPAYGYGAPQGNPAFGYATTQPTQRRNVNPACPYC